MLALGQSRPWPKVMQMLTGTENMNASSLLRYFKPLEEWLTSKNKELKVKLGWD